MGTTTVPTAKALEFAIKRVRGLLSHWHDLVYSIMTEKGLRCYRAYSRGGASGCLVM